MVSGKTWMSMGNVQIRTILVGGFKHFLFSIWECHHPNWRTHIFQRGRYTTNQYNISWCWTFRYELFLLMAMRLKSSGSTFWNEMRIPDFLWKPFREWLDFSTSALVSRKDMTITQNRLDDNTFSLFKPFQVMFHQNPFADLCCIYSPQVTLAFFDGFESRAAGPWGRI